MVSLEDNEMVMTCPYDDISTHTYKETYKLHPLVDKNIIRQPVQYNTCGPFYTDCQYQ